MYSQFSPLISCALPASGGESLHPMDIHALECYTLNWNISIIRLFDRECRRGRNPNDHVINMCELKYYSKPYRVSKSDYDKNIKREELLASMIAPREVVHILSLIFYMQYSHTF